MLLNSPFQNWCWRILSLNFFRFDFFKTLNFFLPHLFANVVFDFICPIFPSRQNLPLNPTFPNFKSTFFSQPLFFSLYLPLFLSLSLSLPLPLSFPLSLSLTLYHSLSPSPSPSLFPSLCFASSVKLSRFQIFPSSSKKSPLPGFEFDSYPHAFHTHCLSLSHTYTYLYIGHHNIVRQKNRVGSNNIFKHGLAVNI